MSELLGNILEKYKARGGDEQRFMDKHTDNVEVTNAPGREGSSEGEKRKKHDRKKKRQGNEAGEDEAAYESVEEIMTLIDQAISELSEELEGEELEAFKEFIETSENYQSFVEAVLEESDFDVLTEEEDEDEEDEEDDEDKKNAEVKVNESKQTEAKLQKLYRSALGASRYNKHKGDLSSTVNKDGELVISDRGTVLTKVAKGDWEKEVPELKK